MQKTTVRVDTIEKRRVEQQDSTEKLLLDCLNPLSIREGKLSGGSK